MTSTPPNVALVGVSVDDEESHRCFAEDQGLQFPLVSDPDGELTEKLGLIKDYGEYGKLAGRVTLLLDRDAIVRADVVARGAGSHGSPRPDARGRARARGELMPGHLVQQADVAPRIDNDGVETRTTIDASCGCQALVQSVVSASRSAARRAPRWPATSSRCSCSRARRRSTSTASATTS